MNARPLPTGDLADFLLTRIAEDEATAQAATQVPEGIERVVKRPHGFDAPQDADPEPLGSWGWNGGPHDNDDPEWRRFAAALNLDPGSGVGMAPYYVIDGAGWDEDEPIGAAYRVAEIPARCSGVARHIAMWNPQRVLTECETKRQIVQRCQMLIDSFERTVSGSDEYIAWPDVNRREKSHAWASLYALAQPYAEHPDFREEWRPY